MQSISAVFFVRLMGKQWRDSVIYVQNGQKKKNRKIMLYNFSEIKYNTPINLKTERKDWL